MWLKIPRLRRPHKNKIIAMPSMFTFAHERSTLTSSSSIPSSRTTSQVTLPIKKHCAAPPNEESGPLANTTSSHDTIVHVQRITERIAQMFHSRNTRGTRIAHCSVSTTICHPSVMPHILPHLPQSTSTRTLSPTSLVFRPLSPSLSCPSELDQETLRDSWRSGRWTKSASPTDDEEFKDITMRNARRKLETPMPAAMPCKTSLCRSSETCCAIGGHKTKYACIVEADESLRIRMEIRQF